MVYQRKLNNILDVRIIEAIEYYVVTNDKKQE